MNAATLKRKILSGSFVAFSLKILGAALSYFMFVVLAQALDLPAFGTFSFAFSVAQFLAIFALAGQQEFTLRVLPGFSDNNGAVAIGFSLRRIGRVFAATAILFSLAGLGLPHLFGTTLFPVICLVAALTLAELASSILRVREKIAMAVAPRDVIWRVVVIGFCLLVIIGILPAPSAGATVLFLAVTLLLLVFWQLNGADVTIRWRATAAPCEEMRQDWVKMSNYFWLTSTLGFASPTLSVAFIGAFFSQDSSGPFFAALKTSQMMSLVLLAANIVASPMIAKCVSDGDLASVRSICRLTSLLAGASALIGFLVLVFLGSSVLGIFGAGFSQAYLPLIIMAFGFVVNGLNGSSGVLLGMSGHEKGLARILVVCNGISLLTLPAFCWFGGTLGAALSVALTSISWNLWSLIYSRRHLGVDPSVLSFVFPPKNSPDAGPEVCVR